MWTWLLLLAPVVVIAAFVWNYRRQAAAREAASAERMKAFLEQTRASPSARPADRQLTTPAARPAAVARRVQPQPQIAAGFTAHARLLNAEQTALYHLLKGALPEHAVFARVSLAACLQPAEHVTGFAREAQRRQLADATVDFLVCDSTMKPVAAICLNGAGGAGAHPFAQSCVAETELRFMVIDARALPKPDDIRAQVCGG